MRQQDDRFDLETSLRQALAPQRSPHGLVDRVMARVRTEPEPGSPREGQPADGGGWLTFPMGLRWSMAAGTAFAVLFVAGVVADRWQEKREAEQTVLSQAERDLAETLQLAGMQWNRAQRAALGPLEDYDDD